MGIRIKTVYVFGAGASAADDAPTISNFFREAYKYFKGNGFYRPLWTFIEEYYHCNIGDVSNFESELPWIDEVISTIDWAIANNISLMPSYGQKETIRLQNDLIFLMSETIIKSLLGKNETYHDKFIKLLCKSDGTFDTDIVSLNYDLLLDTSISKVVGGPIYYGLGKRRPTNAVRLYKLHGSLNWAVCSFCQQIKVFNGKIGLSCPDCSSPNLSPVLVTPTILKSYNIPDLSRIWNEAFHSISTAEKLVFIGYSLPPADFAIIELIKRATHMGGRLQEVHVIDYHKQSVVDRYKQIFGKNRVIGHLDGFDGSLV